MARPDTVLYLKQNTIHDTEPVSLSVLPSHIIFIIPNLVNQSGLGSILDTVSKDTEDTAHSCILAVSKIHFQPTFINGICTLISKRYRSYSLSCICICMTHFKSIFPNPAISPFRPAQSALHLALAVGTDRCGHLLYAADQHALL